jgi:hypothetical protein
MFASTNNVMLCLSTSGLIALFSCLSSRLDLILPSRRHPTYFFLIPASFAPLYSFICFCHKINFLPYQSPLTRILGFSYSLTCSNIHKRNLSVGLFFPPFHPYYRYSFWHFSGCHHDSIYLTPLYV